MSTITTNKKLISEMEKGGELIPLILGTKTTYILESKGHLWRNVRRSVAESVLNDIRFRQKNEAGHYVYNATRQQP